MGDLSTRIKAKYPQYRNVPDDQLEQMIVKKYPQYQSMVQPKQNIVDKAVNSNFIPSTMATLGSIAGMPGGLPGSAAGAGAGQAVGMGLQNSAQRLTDPNVATRDKLLMAAKAIPGFMSGGIPGAVGNLSGQGMAQLDPKDVAKKSAVTGGTDLAFGAAGSLVGKVAKPVGKKFFEWALSKPANIAKREFGEKVSAKLAGESKDDIVDRMINDGFRGSPVKWAAKAKEGQKKAWSKVDEIINKATKQKQGLVEYGTKTAKRVELTVDDFLEPMAKQLRETPPGFIQKAGPAYQEVVDELRKLYKGGLDLKDIVELNKRINSQIFTAADNPTTSQAAKTQAYQALNDVIKPYIKDNYPKLSDALNDYGFYTQVGKIAEKTGTKAPTKISNILQLVNLPFKLLQNPVSATNIGSALYRGGQALPKVTAPLGAYLGSQSE
jgi:hypothetical protein